MSFHDDTKINDIFEETAKKLIIIKINEADKDFNTRTEKEQQKSINENFKGVQKAMINAMKTNHM